MLLKVLNQWLKKLTLANSRQTGKIDSFFMIAEIGYLKGGLMAMFKIVSVYKQLN